jgi:hypothetical protein
MTFTQNYSHDNDKNHSIVTGQTSDDPKNHNKRTLLYATYRSEPHPMSVLQPESGHIEWKQQRKQRHDCVKSI